MANSYSFLGGPALISAYEIVFLDPFSALPHTGLFMPLSDIIIYHILIWVLLVCLVPLTIRKFFQVREDILLVFVFTTPNEVTGLQYVPNSYYFEFKAYRLRLYNVYNVPSTTFDIQQIVNKHLLY